MKITKHMVLPVLLSAIFALSLVSPAYGYNLQNKFIPSDATWLIHLDFKVLLKTKIWDEIFQGEKKKIFNSRERKFFKKGKDELVKELNFDILNDLNSVSIYGKSKRGGNAVVILSGKFDRQKIIRKLNSIKHLDKSKYGNLDVYSWDNDNFGSFINGDLLIITHSKKNLESALDIIKGKSTNFIGTDLFKRLKEIPHNSILFALTENLSSLVGKHLKAPVIINKSRMAFFLALEKNSGIKLLLKLYTESREAAKNIMQIGNGLLALARFNENELKEELELFNSIKISVNGKIVKADLLIPSGFILKNIHKY